MRLPITLATAAAVAALASCTTAPERETRSPQAAAELAEKLAGRTAGPTKSCIPNYPSTQMQVIDDYTILFDAGSTVYVQNPQGGCRGLANGSYTLVTRQYGTQLCANDIHRMVDLQTGMQGGACVFSEFVPYKRQG
ncbi:hypothetical protein [Sphingomonas xanthus]|uniref:Lipoprotein n=1 Tax=Sphingomonas xanthus TaxID=2594473 RepID=A0A516IR84_9SPHN|nr:hypothetical protein [Sphingomonas xanthus]QDP19423.1 hypothetical protein FMM02_05270 [Sphingomonas xanthus]